MNKKEALEKGLYFLSWEENTIPEEKVKELQEIILLHNSLYYEKESPIISDFEYDILFKKLKYLEEKYDVDQKITASVWASFKQSSFKKVAHSRPMISLDNTYDEKDLADFDERVKKNLWEKYNEVKEEAIMSLFNDSETSSEWQKWEKITIQKWNSNNLSYILEFKFDGLGIELIYEEGNLIQAITRGNWIEWEDVTENIMQIKNIPKQIQYTKKLEVRGEVVMPISSFEMLNKEAKKNGEKIFSNPRNAASGSLRVLDTNITKKRNLKFFAYDLANFAEFIQNPPTAPLIKGELKGDYTYYEVIKDLENLGFEISRYFKKCKNVEEVIKNIENFWNIKKEIDFEIDGLVIKVNNIQLWEAIGFTEHHPRYAVAYKFPTEIARTKILSVEHSVGRTGTITPVANLEPIHLWWVIVKRATLHNYDEVENLDVRIGDTIFIKRAGEVIPKILSVVKELRQEKSQKIEIPLVCHICHTKVEKDEGKVRYYCPNTRWCPAQIKESIAYSIGKTGFNIDGLWEKQIELFLEEGIINDLVDIFKIAEKKDILLLLPWLKEKSVQNIIDAIEKAKKQKIEDFLSALVIPWVGKKTAKTLAPLFDSKQSLLDFNITKEDLEDLEDIGPEIANSVFQFFREKKDFISRLLEVLDIEFSKKIVWEGVFTKKKICITGSFENYTRDQLITIIEENGGEFVSSISVKTDFLLAGESAWTKLTKAKSLGVKVLNISYFFDVINRKNIS